MTKLAVDVDKGVIPTPDNERAVVFPEGDIIREPKLWTSETMLSAALVCLDEWHELVLEGQKAALVRYKQIVELACTQWVLKHPTDASCVAFVSEVQRRLGVIRSTYPSCAAKETHQRIRQMLRFLERQLGPVTQ